MISKGYKSDEFLIAVAMSNGKRIIIGLTEQQNLDLEKLLKRGVYQTKAEAVRDAVRLLIRTKSEEMKK